MRIRYEVTAEDIVAFMKYYRRHSPSIKRLQIIVTITLAAITIVTTLAVSIPFRSIVAAGIGGVILLSVLLALVFVRLGFQGFLFRFNVEDWHVRRLLKETGKGMTGFVEVETTDRGIQTCSERGESLILWNAIRDLVFTETHLFVIFDNLAGLAVPRSGVSPIELDRFAAEVKRHMDLIPKTN